MKKCEAAKENEAMRQALSPGIVLWYYNKYIESESRSSYLPNKLHDVLVMFSSATVHLIKSSVIKWPKN